MSKVLSVVIPTRNVLEHGKVGLILENLDLIEDKSLFEVFVCDFESDDGLRELVDRYDFVKLLDCPEGGTAKQINFGLRKCSGEYVLIHHGRSIIDDYNFVLDFCLEGKWDWMYFYLKFDYEHWFLKSFVGFLSTYLRPGLGGAIYWDQCNLVRREFMDKVGGVPILDIMEDVEFSRNLRKIGLKPKLISFVNVTTSAHRFLKNGIYAQHWRNMYIKTAHWLGWKSVAELKDMYK